MRAVIQAHTPGVALMQAVRAESCVHLANTGVALIGTAHLILAPAKPHDAREYLILEILELPRLAAVLLQPRQVSLELSRTLSTLLRVVPACNMCAV